MIKSFFRLANVWAFKLMNCSSWFEVADFAIKIDIELVSAFNETSVFSNSAVTFHWASHSSWNCSIFTKPFTPNWGINTSQETHNHYHNSCLPARTAAETTFNLLENLLPAFGWWMETFYCYRYKCAPIFVRSAWVALFAAAHSKQFCSSTVPKFMQIIQNSIFQTNRMPRDNILNDKRLRKGIICYNSFARLREIHNLPGNGFRALVSRRESWEDNVVAGLLLRGRSTRVNSTKENFKRIRHWNSRQRDVLRSFPISLSLSFICNENPLLESNWDKQRIE